MNLKVLMLAPAIFFSVVTHYYLKLKTPSIHSSASHTSLDFISEPYPPLLLLFIQPTNLSKSFKQVAL